MYRSNEIEPNSNEDLFLLGNGKLAQGNFNEAINIYKKILESLPNNLSVQLNLCVAYFKKGNILLAKRVLTQIVNSHPNHGEAWNNLAKILRETGEIEEAIQCYKKAIHLLPDSQPIESNMLFAYNYCISKSSEEISNVHIRWGENNSDLNILSKNFSNEKSLHRSLRIGYVSPDFRKHAVMFFLKPILKNHDSKKFRIYCYSDTKYPDDDTHFVQKQVPHFFSCYNISNHVLAKKIQDHRIDILVDLTGHSSKNRLLVFSQRPAPVQVTYLGYQNTTGLKAINYLITDQWSSPPEQKGHLFAEQLFRIPDCFLCFQPSDHTPEVNISPLFQKGYTTFGVLNNFSRMNNLMISAWIKILKKVPKAKMIIQSRPFSDLSFTQKFMQRFKQQGIDPSRLTLYPYGSLDDFYLRHHDIDLILDTYPDNGASTLCQALWMGVPVLTCSGTTFASRVGGSLLHTLGLDDLIAASLDDYIQKAVYLTQHPEILIHLRQILRPLLSQSTLCNGKLFTQKLESAYKKMWRTYCGYAL
ncbi:TPR repeat-containing protein [Candidatus Magnetomorum sp. HK-1]|nr:TPR repeat-containing protein [Candidatus Magnetomorum sp. HK-1]